MGLHVATDVIDVRDLAHRYGSRQALAGTTYQVQAGEVFGLLGPNGAGKSTTIRLLLGKQAPSAGQVTVLGHAPHRAPAVWRRQIGWLGEAPGHYLRLSVHSNLKFFAALAGVGPARIDAVLADVQLEDRRRSPVRDLSRGMRQRLALARALLAEPPLLLLDEPTTGLDVEATRQVRNLIEQLAASGKTIFLTTHDLEEAEQLCQRVAVLRAGQILAVDTPQGLCRQALQADWQPPAQRVSLEKAYRKLVEGS